MLKSKYDLVDLLFLFNKLSRDEDPTTYVGIGNHIDSHQVALSRIILRITRTFTTVHYQHYLTLTMCQTLLRALVHFLMQST